MSGPGAPAGARLRRLALHWLLFVFAFCLGIFLYASERWPYGLVQALRAFLESEDDADLSVGQKLQNDLGLLPQRHIADLGTPFAVPESYRPLEGLPLKSRRSPPLVHLGADALRGWRLVYGTFDFEDHLHGAVLLDPDGGVARVWQLTQEGVDWAHWPDSNVVPHGFDIAPDGSIVVAFDGGTSLSRYDFCGAVQWRVMGGFHHSVDRSDDGTLWAWGQTRNPQPWGDHLIQVDHATGAVLDSFRIGALVAANPDIDIFAIRQRDTSTESKWMKDPWHANDIDPLPAVWAGRYPGFEAGDLLISLRAIDLLAVIDPATRRVRWWRQGLTRRQHDPDWNARGTITVFDNNMHRGPSRIVEIDPGTFEHRTLLAGADHEFYTWRRGKHQQLPDGGLLVTSTEQGRVFEVGPGGEIRFEFINRYRDGLFLTLSEAFFLPPDYFAAPLPDCGGGAGP